MTTDNARFPFSRIVLLSVSQYHTDDRDELSVIKYSEENSGEVAAGCFSVDPKRVKDWPKNQTELQRPSEEDSNRASCLTTTCNAHRCENLVLPEVTSLFCSDAVLHPEDVDHAGYLGQFSPLGEDFAEISLMRTSQAV